MSRTTTIFCDRGEHEKCSGEYIASEVRHCTCPCHTAAPPAPPAPAGERVTLREAREHALAALERIEGERQAERQAEFAETLGHPAPAGQDEEHTLTTPAEEACWAIFHSGDWEPALGMLRAEVARLRQALAAAAEREAALRTKLQQATPAVREAESVLGVLIGCIASAAERGEETLKIGTASTATDDLRRARDGLRGLFTAALEPAAAPVAPGGEEKDQ